MCSILETSKSLKEGVFKDELFVRQILTAYVYSIGKQREEPTPNGWIGGTYGWMRYAAYDGVKMSTSIRAIRGYGCAKKIQIYTE
jgi:hypothetical protein